MLTGSIRRFATSSSIILIPAIEPGDLGIDGQAGGEVVTSYEVLSERV